MHPHDLTRGEQDHGDLARIDDGENTSAGVRVTDAGVVHAAGPTQAHPAVTVDGVEAEPEATGPDASRWLRGRPYGTRLSGRAPADGPMRSVLVVAEAKASTSARSSSTVRARGCRPNQHLRA